jgi:hypothetical protein
MEKLIYPKCFDCVHFLDTGDCRAFPNGIPTSIMLTVKHDKVFEGQVGTFIYESKNQSKDLN